MAPKLEDLLEDRKREYGPHFSTSARAILREFREKLALPAEWRCYEKPTNENAIPRLDDTIEYLVKRRRTEMKDQGIDCPYYDARLGIVVAALWARDTVRKENQRRLRRERQKAVEKEVKELSEGLRQVFCSPLKRNPVRFFDTDAAPMDEFGIGRCDTAEVSASLRAIGDDLAIICRAIQALDNIRGRLQTERERPMPSRKQNLWQEGFIQALAITWHRLAGVDPKIEDDKDFREFAEACAEALGGSASVPKGACWKPANEDDNILANNSFENALREIKSGGRRRPWDKLDRYDEPFSEEADLDDPRRAAIGRRFWPLELRRLLDGDKSLPPWLRALISQGR